MLDAGSIQRPQAGANVGFQLCLLVECSANESLCLTSKAEATDEFHMSHCMCALHAKSRGERVTTCRHRQLEAVPIDLGHMWLPWSAADGQLTCTPWEYVEEPCLTDGVGLLPWEWQHFKQQHESNSQPGAEAVKQHTLYALHAEGASTQYDAHVGFNLTEHTVAIDSTQVLEEADEHKHEPIMLLSNLVHGLGADQQQPLELDMQQQACRVLNTSQILTKYSEEHWNLLEGRPTDLHNLHTAVRFRAGKLHRRDHDLLVHQQGEVEWRLY